jgi:hypothetical protein
MRSMIDADRYLGIGASADPLWKGRRSALAAALVRVQLVHDGVAAASSDQPAVDRERRDEGDQQ